MLLQCSPSAAAARAFVVKLIQVNHTQATTKRIPRCVHAQCYKWYKCYKWSQLLRKPWDIYVQCSEWIQLLHNHYLQNMGQKLETVGQEPDHAILANLLFPYTYYIPGIVRKYISFVSLFLVAVLGKWCNADKNSGNNCFLRILAKVR